MSLEVFCSHETGRKPTGHYLVLRDQDQFFLPGHWTSSQEVYSLLLSPVSPHQSVVASWIYVNNKSPIHFVRWHGDFTNQASDPSLCRLEKDAPTLHTASFCDEKWDAVNRLSIAYILYWSLCLHHLVQSHLNSSDSYSLLIEVFRIRQPWHHTNLIGWVWPYHMVPTYILPSFWFYSHWPWHLHQITKTRTVLIGFCYNTRRRVKYFQLLDDSS